jgi:hypothetical protein
VVRAEGSWDATLGLSKETPIGLTNIELTERCCVIYQTLRNPPDMGYRIAP